MKEKVIEFFQALEHAEELSKRNTWTGSYLQGKTEEAHERHMAWMKVHELRAQLLDMCNVVPVTLSEHNRNDLIFAVRKATGCGMIAAKVALADTGWDKDKAIERIMRAF